MKINGREIETMEEAMVAIGYLQKKFENEYDLVERYMKYNDKLCFINKEAWKQVDKFRNKNKGLRSIIFGMCIATGMFALYHVEKTSKLENRNSVLRSTLDKLEAEADDKLIIFPQPGDKK